MVGGGILLPGAHIMAAEEEVGEDVGIVALDVELECLDASRYIEAFADPRQRQDALEQYAELVSDAVKEAYAIEQDEDRDAAIRYIIGVICEAKDFNTADKLLAKVALEDNRQKAAGAISAARLQAMNQ
jgi:hypothetical protein